MDATSLARELYDEALADEQSVRRLSSEHDAAVVRAEVRRLARLDGVKIRTALLPGGGPSGSVAVVLLDAELWTQPTATMRAKLTPPAS